MGNLYQKVQLSGWKVADLDGQPVHFDLILKGARVFGSGIFQVTEVHAGAYVTILAIEQENDTIRRLDLNQDQVNAIQKSESCAGLICEEPKPVLDQSG